MPTSAAVPWPSWSEWPIKMRLCVWPLAVWLSTTFHDSSGWQMSLMTTTVNIIDDEFFLIIFFSFPDLNVFYFWDSSIDRFFAFAVSPVVIESSMFRVGGCRRFARFDFSLERSGHRRCFGLFPASHHPIWWAPGEHSLKFVCFFIFSFSLSCS